MASSLSNLVDNLFEGIHKIKFIDSNKCCLEYTNFKDGLIEFKYLCCNKNYQEKLDENLKKEFVNRYKFANQDVNQFILLLYKGVYLYEYIDDWGKFRRHHCQKKKIFIVI